MSRWTVFAITAGVALSLGPTARAAQPKPTPTLAPTQEQPAIDAAAPWLAMIDSGQYGESWDASATLFKQSVTRAQWVDGLTKSRSPLGRVLTRTFQAARYQTDLPGAPTGEYVMIQYATTFQDGGASTETITPMKDPDGAWRVSGYFIRPVK